MTSEATRRLYAAPEVADEFRITVDTVRSLVRRGEIEAIRMGRGQKAGYRFTRAALDAYLTKQSTAARRHA